MKQWTHGGNIYRYGKKLIDFSANINPLGMPEEVKAALQSCGADCERYPDPYCLELTAALSDFHGVNREYICCGNGAADLIFRLCLLKKPKTALIPQPTFSEYEKALDLVGCKTEYFELKEQNGFALSGDFTEKITQGVDIVFLCSPNNPTGAVCSRELLIKCAQKCREVNAAMVLDECFLDFLREEKELTMAPFLEDFPNLIILKAFTKIFAMAGVRLGYCLCSDDKLIANLWQVLQPWSVSTPAQKCGVAALKCSDYLEKTLDYTEKGRENLKNSLRELGYTVFDSKANYVFFKSEKPLLKPLFDEGILIRSCENYPFLGDKYYRVAVRSEEENRLLISALKKVR